MINGMTGYLSSFAGHSWYEWLTVLIHGSHLRVATVLYIPLHSRGIWLLCRDTATSKHEGVGYSLYADVFLEA